MYGGDRYSVNTWWNSQALSDGRRRDENLPEAQAGRFRNPSLHLADATHLARKANLTNGGQLMRKGNVPEAGGNREGDGQVRGRFRNPQPANSADDDVMTPQRQPSLT
jgi:hypothetical protein